MKWQKSLGVLAKLALLGSNIVPPTEILLISLRFSSNARFRLQNHERLNGVEPLTKVTSELGREAFLLQ